MIKTSNVDYGLFRAHALPRSCYQGGRIMDTQDKAERLSESAHISLEEAMTALEAADGDMLDAMVLLENQGKVERPGQSVYSTSYREQQRYIDVPGQVAQQKEAAPSFKRSFVGMVRSIIRFLKFSSLRITQNERILLTIPSWIILLILLIAWKFVLPVAAVALLFGARYSFIGNENTDVANSILSQAGDIADDLKSRLHRKNKDKDDDT